MITTKCRYCLTPFEVFPLFGTRLHLAQINGFCTIEHEASWYQENVSPL